jgi:hypothetical protein
MRAVRLAGAGLMLGMCGCAGGVAPRSAAVADNETVEKENFAMRHDTVVSGMGLNFPYSEDFGRTWKNNQGTVVAVLDGKTRGTPASIGIATPGIVARPTRYLWGQMNTTTQYVDTRGRVHVVNWQQQQDAPISSMDMNTWRYYHYWRDTDGPWRENPLPFFGRKPQIVLDAGHNAYVVYCKGDNIHYHGFDHGGKLTVARATEQSGWTDWQTVWSAERDSVGEPLIDVGRWENEGILSVYLQDKPEKPGQPSALRVLDFRPGRP